MAAPVGGRVAVSAGHCAAAGVRVQRADWAADVRAVGEQGAAGGEWVARGWGEAARDTPQAGAGACWGEQVTGGLGHRAVQRQAAPVHLIAIHWACVRPLAHRHTVS